MFSLNIRLRKKHISFLVFLALLAVAFVPILPLLQVVQGGEWPVTHEYNRYFLIMEEFRVTFNQGFIYPRWLSNLYGGYGYPTFVFYQPGFFFLNLPFSYLLNDPILTFTVSLYSIVFLGAAGIYLLCRELSNRAMGLLCTLLYLLTPYLYLNLYARGDLSELMAMLFCPWPLYFLVLLKRKLEAEEITGGAMLGLACSLAAVIYAHPATALLFCISFGAFCFFLSLESLRVSKPLFVRALAGCSLGLVLSSPYWLPVFQLEPYVNLQAATEDYYQASRHVVYPHQLVSRDWEFGESVPDSPDDTMSFQLGACHLALALFGAAIGWKKRRFFRIVFGLYAGLILLMTPPAAPIWESISTLKKVQFPWRTLSVSATYQTLLLTGAYPLFRRWNKTVVVGICLVVVLLTLFWHTDQFKTHPAAFPASEHMTQYRTEKFKLREAFTGVNEFLPITAMKAMPPRSDPELGPPLLNILEKKTAKSIGKHFPDSTRFHLHAEIINSEEIGVLINQIYFKGWKVFVDGKVIPSAVLERGLTQDGRMLIHLSEEGSHTIRAFYDGPPGALFRTLMIGVSLVLFGAFWYWEKTTILTSRATES